jgi:hypothetical protein
MSGMGTFAGGMQMGSMGSKSTAQQIRQGRIIVGVSDPLQGEVFRNAFTQLGAPIDCVVAMGPENVWNTCQQVRSRAGSACMRSWDAAEARRSVQAANSGGFDFVLLHPEYLRDRAGSSLLTALRNNSVRLAAFGYEPTGFVRDLIQSAGITHFIPGPTAQGVDLNMLSALTCQMQAANAAAMVGAIPVRHGLTPLLWNAAARCCAHVLGPLRSPPACFAPALWLWNRTRWQCMHGCVPMRS